MQRTKATDIDSYIACFPPEIQEKLQKLRMVIREAAPTAVETINYHIPTFKLYGNLVHFAAYSRHIGFYPGSGGIEKFKDKLAGYKGAKGTVQFSFDKEIPYELIREIVEFRVQENMAKGN
jgi:uncharacterized protein YdhG (YjbR/CyaY superfamily)